MQVVILAGGLGTRISEETHIIPKPMIDIGGLPIIVHIMHHFASYGHKDFVIALGYKGNVIKEYFSNFKLYQSDIEIDSNSISILNSRENDWNVKLIDTGLSTLTGGRVKRLSKYLEDNFLLTYGDGISSVDIRKLLDFHNKTKSLATVTAVRPPARFGALELTGNFVTSFTEKSTENTGWINGGFFVFSKEILNYIQGDDTILELEPMQKLVEESQLKAFMHTGFWHPLDSMRDKLSLESIFAKTGKWPN